MQPTIQPSGNKVKLANDFTVKLGALVITILKGYKSDGASVPQIFWSLGFDPFAPKTLSGALVHDILYTVKVFDRKTTDGILYALLRQNGVGIFKSSLYWIGVRLGGWLPWKLTKKSAVKHAWEHLQIVNNVL